MSDKFKLPSKKAVVFWPVGTGDSTTLVIKPGEVAIQIDLHHMEKADNEDEPEWHIIDHLVRILPKRNGKPYLAAFVLTHPDLDHIQGFAELLKKVHIGELWHTPKIFRDYANQEEMCDDAKAFRKEADRRRSVIIKSPDTVQSGDRIRVIGHDDILLEEKYKDLPAAFKSRPSDTVTAVDGIDMKEDFKAFIHAPFKNDQAKDKNNTSLSLNVVLYEGKKYGQFFFFGDREYPTIKRIFERTEETATSDDAGNTPFLSWDVMLCSHHCSKAVMHWQEEGDSEKVFKQDIMNYFEKYSRGQKGYIVSSSHSKFSDGVGDNPPHKKARNKYEKIVESGHFICTHEYPSKDSPSPLIFLIGTDGLEFKDERKKSSVPVALTTAVTLARGGEAPPSMQVGFGKPS
jgi:hypothetical protein